MTKSFAADWLSVGILCKGLRRSTLIGDARYPAWLENARCAMAGFPGDYAAQWAIARWVQPKADQYLDASRDDPRRGAVIRRLWDVFGEYPEAFEDAAAQTRRRLVGLRSSDY